MVDHIGEAEPDPAEQLAMHHGRAELALSAAGMGEFEWDFSRDLFIVSQRMSAITGIEEGVVAAQGGLFALGFIHPDDVETVNATVSERLIRDGSYRVRYRMIRPDDGRTQWMESSATILRGPQGPVTKVKIGRASCRERV